MMRVLIVFLIVLVLGFFLLGDAWSTDVRIPSQPVAVNSHNSFSKTIEKLKGAIKKRNLTIIFELDYEEIMGAAGIEGKNLVTIGFVGPEMEQELLRAEPKAALEIPLRIAVRELDNGAVDFVYYQPSYLMSHYQNRDLEKLKQKMDILVGSIIKEAAGNKR
jgi:uncharacterized protein (DUF302 family)